MTPTAINPVVVIQVNEAGAIVAAATNCDPELKIVTVTNRDAFNREAAGRTFNSLNVTGATLDLTSFRN